MITIDIEPGIRVLVSPITDGPGSHLERARATVADMMCEAAGRPVSILHRADGAPYPEGLDVHISVSHSRRLAALAISERGAVGVDIEEPRPEQLRRVASRVFRPDEAAYIDSLPGKLLQAWTLKEATFKAAGMADVADLREIRIGADGIELRGRRFAAAYSKPLHLEGRGAWVSLVES